MTGRTGHVSCPGRARPRVPFSRQSPYLCSGSRSPTHRVGWNHTLISDRLPDPAQFARCHRILITPVACEGSHSSRQKVTPITRRTVYLIQSGRKPRVSCQFPWLSGNRPLQPRIVPPACAGRPRREPAVIPGWGAGNAPTLTVVVPGRVPSPKYVIRCAPRIINSQRSPMEWVCLRGGMAAPPSLQRLSCTRRTGFYARRMGRGRRAGGASFCALAEKSVSPGRTLDKRCYFHHTVVYLIRYAML